MDASPATPRECIFEGNVSREWLARGEFLSAAWRKFDSYWLKLAREHALDFARANAILLPEEDSEQSYSIALSIAEDAVTDGTFNGYENIEAVLKFENCQRLADIEIRQRFCGAPGGLVAYGRRENAAGVFEWIPADAWLRLKKDENIPNFISGGGVSYYMVRVIDPAQWLGAEVSEPEQPAAKYQRHSSQAELEKFVREYIAKMRAAGETGSKKGLERAWRDCAHVGKRDQLRSEYQKLIGATAGQRGRPRKIAAK